MDNNVVGPLTTNRRGVADGQGSSVMATLNDTFRYQEENFILMTKF